MDIICNRCGDENAFFNGASYECPNCENEWGFIDEDSNRNNLEDEDDDESILEQFTRLSALKKPFFKLKHGKLYNCKVQCEVFGRVEIENWTILPLAYAKNENNFFILLNPLEIQKQYPNAIKDFAKMDFNYIWNDGINSYVDDSSLMPLKVVCSTCEDDTIVSYNSLFFGFEEVK